MEILSAAAVENEDGIEVGKRIKAFTGRGNSKKDGTWLNRGVKNRIQKDKGNSKVIEDRSKKTEKSISEKGKLVKEEKERVSHSSLDSSCDVCNEDGCNTSIEGNNGSDSDSNNNNPSDDGSSDINPGDDGKEGNCGSDSYDIDTDKQDSIIETTLHRYPDSSLGFRVVGGSNTPLQYICIHSFLSNTPAFNCGLFRKGDQLVMVGDTCMIGLTREEANLILEHAPPVVKIIAQRKLEATGSQECSKIGGKGRERAVDVIPTTPRHFQPVEKTNSEECIKTVKSTCSQERPKTRKGKEKARSVGPGATMVVDLRPSPGEILGISITGGRSDPYLKNIHVKRLVPNGVAVRDGRIEKGDCILSVNTHSLSGLTKKEAARVLKEARGHVILVIRRLEEPQKAGSSKKIPPTSMPERGASSQQGTRGKEKVEKHMYSSIFSWMGKKGIQQAAEKISKLVGETTASLTSLGVFGSKEKSSSPSTEESDDNGPGGLLQLEDECINSTENSEPDLTSQVDPERRLEQEEHDCSSITSYTEVFTSDGGESRKSLQHWQGDSRSSLSSYQGFKPLSETVLREYRRKYPETKKLIDVQCTNKDGIGQEVSASSMDAQRSELSSEALPRTSGSTQRGEKPHAEQQSMMTQEALLSLLSPEGSHMQSEVISVHKTGEEISSDNHSMHTHSSSEQDSMPASTDYSHVEKIQLPLPWSPQHYHLRESSEDTALGQHRATTPSYTKKRQHNSVNPQGEVLTFRDQKSTLPRRISGSRDNLRLVELRKGAGWLGIQLQGGVDPNDMTHPITVRMIIRGGAAYRSGRIHEGDEIIEVNGILLANLTLRKAVDTVRQQPQGNIVFILRENHYGYCGYSCRKKLF